MQSGTAHAGRRHDFGLRQVAFLEWSAEAYAPIDRHLQILKKLL
jgi:hypothetical protein